MRVLRRDSTRFADSGAWGYAEFEYDAPSDAFRSGGPADQPPQANDAKCGFACHTVVAKKDYVFTAYGKRDVVGADGLAHLIPDQLASTHSGEHGRLL